MKQKTKQFILAINTPLASIFGSGFLVIVPILASAVGPYSPLAMAAVCLLAYFVGAVIRYNIKHAEPVLANSPPKHTYFFERTSDFALIVAYIISVSLYLNILSAFVLGGMGIDSPMNENYMTTIILMIMTTVGVSKGLNSLENLETYSLLITLIIIVLLFTGFSCYDWNAWHQPTGLILPKIPAHTPWEVMTIVAGTLIVVQGFETPRYLGEIFKADIRISASRWSQILSTLVYLIFVILTLPILHTLNGKYSDNSLINLVGTASVYLVTPLVIAATFSQFSAAIADTLAATGAMEESSNQLIKEKIGYLLVAFGAIALTWASNTFEIVALASRAFAFYYMLQCLVAATLAQSRLQQIGILILASILGWITIFAVSLSEYA